MSPRTRFVVSGSLAGILCLTALGCSSNEESVESTVVSTVPTTTAASTTTSTLPPVSMFGTMPSPCGTAVDGEIPKIAEGQNAAESLTLGVANDSSSTAAFGGSDMLDAARAFAQWCNDQGGIRGLQIEIVDLDAGVTGVPLAMERACAEVFALVGGGWTFDDQMYPRFHECGLVSFPSFTVSAAASKANGRVQAIPDPIDIESTTWLRWIEETYSEAVGDVAIVHVDPAATSTLAEREAAVMRVVGGFGEPLAIAFDPSGSEDWADIVQQLVDDDIRAVSFIGAPTHLIDMYSAMNAVGYAPDVVFGDGDLVTDEVIGNAVAESLANLRLRSIHPPFTESDPALDSYEEMTSSIDPPGGMSGLGVMTTSSLLLFATAANACLDLEGNVLERECTLVQAKAITSWTAGGLHAPTNPSEDIPPSCIIVLGVEGGSWYRVDPARESGDDGYSCVDAVETLEDDFGDTMLGFDPTRLN